MSAMIYYWSELWSRANILYCYQLPVCLYYATFVCMHIYIAYKYDNFIVGLTNVSPDISTPTLYNYALCAQYPGAVPNGRTVSLYCQDNTPPSRYVIVQIPLVNIHFIPCEVEVFAIGTRNRECLIWRRRQKRSNIRRIPSGPKMHTR